jgi:hypothetical protein
MVGPGIGLMFATPDGPAKPQVDCLVVFADEVEQAPDLAGGEPDQATGPACGRRGGVLWFFFLVWVFCAVRSLWLSTGGGSPF